MKSIFLLSAVLSLAFSQSSPAQAPAKPGSEDAKSADKSAADQPKSPAAEAAGPEAPAAPPKGMANLTDDQRKALLTGMGEVANFIRGVRNLEALEKLNEMETIVGPSHYIENLRGAVYTKMRNFPKARPHFERALELSKGLPEESFHPRFNLAELDFVEAGQATAKLRVEGKPAPDLPQSLMAQWDTARDSFQKLLTDPGKPGTGSDSLINFKLFICALQQKKEAEADVVMKNFDQYDADSPAYYFANAVRCFIKDDKEGANEWLESARKIYPKEINEVFNDSLVEMGWLETLQ
jgi:tetratricopeptide (TPR) repeat protein